MEQDRTDGRPGSTAVLTEGGVATRGPFVGRERELGMLLSGLADATRGRGGAVLIGGEPGVGKSRLADEFAERARELGASVLWGRAWEGAGAPPYWPWIQALRAHIRSAPPGTLRDELGLGAADIAQMLPEVRTLVPEIPPPPPESDAARFQLFDSTTSFLRNVGSARETVLVLDDLHAADTPSILLLRFVASQLAGMRLLILATYRDIELSPEHPLTSAIDEMDREPTVRRLALGGLREDAFDQLVRSAVGGRTSQQLARDLWVETKGNPLFLGEAIRLLAAEGRLADVATAGMPRLAIPAGVREVIRRRLGKLSDDTVELLTIGAALGPEFSADTLRRISSHPPDRLLELLGEAIGAGLVAPVTTTPRRFRFSHDLIREAVYQEVAPADRADLHGAIARVLEELYAATLEPHLAELAYHYHEAAEASPLPGESGGKDRFRDKALLYARRAGELADAALAYEEAARLYRLALGLLDREDARSDELRTELLLAIGDDDARAGQLDAANNAFYEAAELARRTGVATHLARAALGVGGRIAWARPGKNTQLIPLLQEALVMLGGDDERLRAQLLGRLACAWRSSPDHRNQSAVLSKQALDIARDLGDPATLSYALACRYWATWWPENMDQRVPLVEEMLAVAEATRDGERLIDSQLMLFLLHSEEGRMTEAVSDLRQVERLAEEVRQPSHRWLGTAAPAMTALMLGDFALAEDLVQVELEPGPILTPAHDNVSAATMHLFLLARERGTFARAEPAVRRAVEEFSWYPLHRAALVLLLLDLERESEARALFADLAQDEFRALYRDNEWLLGMALASEACSVLGDPTAAEVLYRQLEPFAGRHAAGHAEGSLGGVDRYLGLLALTLGRLDDAIRHLEDAIELNERMGARPWTAHSRHDLARALRLRDAPGDQARAATLDGEALHAAREIGLTVLASRIEGDGREPGVSEPSASAESAGIFRREGEYWNILFGRDGFRLRDSKGLRYLSQLLAQPGREVLALDLAGEIAGPTLARAPREDDLSDAGLGDSGEHLDAEARQAYRARLHELQEELDQAESWNDPERADRARGEMDFLARELSRAVGLGGRHRSAGSASERARISVTRAIRSAIERIASNSPTLGDHLEATIHTGTYCAYRPDPRLVVAWRT